MRRSSLTAVALALGLSLLSGAASADPKAPIQVLAISSDKNFNNAQALTIALKRAVTRAEGWALAKGDFSLEVLSVAMGCATPPDAACQKKIADKVGTSHYIWGTLEVVGKETVAQLHLWEGGSEKRSTTLRYASNLTDPSDDTLLEIAEGGFAELMGATQGVLVVVAGSVSGEVFVDGEKVGLIKDGRTELTVAPGTHQVLVRAKGYSDATGSINVRPGASAEITLNPTPSGSGTGDATQDGGSKMTTNQMIGYGGIALGAITAGVGGYFWLQTASPDDKFESYRGELAPGTDACDQAKADKRADIVDICDSHSRNQTMAFVLVPVGLVIAGVGTYFLLSDDGKEQSSARRTPKGPSLTPVVGLGPRGGEVKLNVVF